VAISAVSAATASGGVLQREVTTAVP
jgi:hypothetical protein